MDDSGSGRVEFPRGPTARLVEEDGELVADAPDGTVVTDDDVFRLVDVDRRRRL